MARFSGGTGSGDGAPGPRGATGPVGPTGPTGQDANTGDIYFEESTMLSNYDINVTVNSTPGDITLSAYNGVVLGFSDSENSGLRFPDGSLQTTAYTGGSGGETGPTGPAGEGFNWRGEWMSAPGPTGYVVNDVVSYNGSSYVAINSDAGTTTTPDVSEGWDVLASGFNWRGAWEPGPYYLNDVAEYDGSMYVCIVSQSWSMSPPIAGPTSPIPGPNPDWELMASSGAEGTGFRFRGAWMYPPMDLMGASYVVNDIVTHNGSSYILTNTASAAEEPSPIGPPMNWWVVFASQGDGFRWTGTWSSTGVGAMPYVAGDVVEFNGSTYVATPQNGGMVTGEPIYQFPSPYAGDPNPDWELMSSAGEAGQGFVFKGEWSSMPFGGPYVEGDVVSYNSKIYVAQTPFMMSVEPGSGTPGDLMSSGWMLMLSSLEYKGAWESGTVYYKNDIVTYGGAAWIGVPSMMGMGVMGTPGDSSDWEIFAAKGDQGTFSGSWYGNWDVNNTYTNESLVYHNGSTWLSYNNDNLGNEPYSDGMNGMMSHWSLVASGLNFRGAYDSEAFYRFRDIVTHNGSSWIAGGMIMGPPGDENSGWSVFASIGSSANTGDITFDGIQIIGAGTASGDGYNNGTIQLVPDADLLSDQYLIIDPTSPNHIHVRAGGTQDASSAHLIVGGERNNVEVSDVYRSVKIHSRPQAIVNNYGNSNEASNTEFMVATGANILVGDTVALYTGGTSFIVTAVTQDYPYPGLMTVVADGLSFVSGESYTFTREEVWNNEWTFDDDGVFSGPAMGGVKVPAIANAADGTDLYVYATGANVNIQANDAAVVLDGNDGEFLNDSSNPANQIAKIGDLSEESGIAFQSVRWTPNFEATGLVFSGTGSTHPAYNSYYVRQGQLVSFWITIDLATVTDFGTGQLKTALPFAPLAGTMNHFSGWVFVDETANPDLAGHIILNADHLANTTALDLHYIKQQGGANSPVMEAMLKQNTPVVLTTATNIYINGTYIAAPAV